MIILWSSATCNKRRRTSATASPGNSFPGPVWNVPYCQIYRPCLNVLEPKIKDVLAACVMMPASYTCKQSCSLCLDKPYLVSRHLPCLYGYSSSDQFKIIAHDLPPCIYSRTKTSF